MAVDRTTRQRVLLPGKILFPDGLISMDCSIRNQSPAGALIILPTAEPLPNEVWFLDFRQGLAHFSRVAWRRHPQIGLSFIDDADPPNPTVSSGIRRLLLEAQLR